MKKMMVLLAVILSLNIYAQFKEPGFPSESIRDGIVNENSGSLFGFLNSDNFQMKHSYNLSYSSFGNQGLALGMYTNSMYLKLSNNMNVQVDARIIHLFLFSIEICRWHIIIRIMVFISIDFIILFLVMDFLKDRF